MKNKTSKTIKFLQFSGILIWILILLVFLPYRTTMVKLYVNLFHGFDSNVVDTPGINEANMGDVSYTIQKGNDPQFQYRIYTDGIFLPIITEDGYKYGKKSYEIYKKIKPELKEFKELGYLELNPADEFFYPTVRYTYWEVNEHYYVLELTTDKQLDFQILTENDYANLYNIVKKLQEKNTGIDRLSIDGAGSGDNFMSFIDIDLKNVQSYEQMKENIRDYQLS